MLPKSAWIQVVQVVVLCIGLVLLWQQNSRIDQLEKTFIERGQTSAPMNNQPGQASHVERLTQAPPARARTARAPRPTRARKSKSSVDRDAMQEDRREAIEERITQRMTRRADIQVQAAVARFQLDETEEEDLALVMETFTQAKIDRYVQMKTSDEDPDIDELVAQAEDSNRQLAEEVAQILGDDDADQFMALLSK